MSYEPTTTFWQIFHSLLRADDSKAENSRARKCCAWLIGEVTPIRRVCIGVELKLIELVYNHFSANLEAPTFDILKHQVDQKSDPELDEQIDVLSSQQEALTKFDSVDLGALLKNKSEETRQYRLEDLFNKASAINTVGATINPGKGKKKIEMKGPNDAMRFFLERLDAGATGIGAKTHGVLQDDLDDVVELYHKIKSQDINHRQIRTGISGIDNVTSFRKGNFVGALGYVGNRKSTLFRSMAYYNALLGLNTAHISYEQSYEEEMVFYYIAHSHHQKWGNDFNISIKAFHDGRLTKQEEDFLFHVVKKDLEKNVPGKIFIRQPEGGGTFDALRTQVEVMDRLCPLDICFVDYLTLCQTRSGRKEEIEQNIRDAKNWALNFREGEGILFLTPVQGNRRGYEEAAENGGKWESTGIYEYSEYDKSLDVILYVFLDDDLKASGEVILGSCKSRWSDTIAPFKAGVNSSAGIITDLRSVRIDETDVDDLLADI